MKDWYEEPLRKLRHYENVHIPLWLLKDTCWMMEWKAMGVLMIIPTVWVALLIAYKTYGQREFFINSAICFWISANGYWMCCEFFGYVNLKNYAAIPFALGMVCSALFYLVPLLLKRKKN
jgi:hypothetical protein